MQEQNNDKKSKNDKISETVAQDAKLQKEIFDVCETLDGHAEAIGEQMFNAMLEHLNEQYLREYALLNADKLIDVDKQIAELKIKREKELAEIEERRVKQEREIEELKEQQRREFELEKAKAEKEFEIEKTKELGEMQLEHDRVKADIARRRQELDIDIQILEQTAEQELSAKLARVTPGYKLRRRFLGIPIGRLKPNQAWLLSLKAAEISSYEYLSSRAQEISDRKEKYFEKTGGGEEVPDGNQEQSEEVQEQEEAPAEPLSRGKRKELRKRLKKLGKDATAEQVIAETLKVLSEGNEDAEPVFVPEALTESEIKLYLQNLERKDYLEYKAQCKAEKAERKRFKREARQAKKLNKKEAKPPETQAEPKDAPAADQVKIDVDNNTE